MVSLLVDRISQFDRVLSCSICWGDQSLKINPDRTKALIKSKILMITSKLIFYNYLSLLWLFEFGSMGQTLGIQNPTSSFLIWLKKIIC